MLTEFCYTQFADPYQVTYGLLFADRTPKFPLDAIASATSGRFSHVMAEPEDEEALGIRSAQMRIPE